MVAVVLPLAIAGCTAKKNASPDIVLVTVDGNLPICKSMTSENTLLFSDAYTTSPSTLPAAASVLTGRVPPDHGLRVNGVGSLNAQATTLASALPAYRSAAFLSTSALSPIHGLTNGFAIYEAKIALTNRNTAFTTPAARLVDDAIAFKQKKAEGEKKPVFVWVHLSPFAGVTPSDFQAMRAAETNALAEIDRLFSAFKSDSSIQAVVPLYNIDTNAVFPGLSIDVPATRVTVAVSGPGLKGLCEKPFSIAEIKNVVLDAVAGKPFACNEQASVYSESVMPWYILRLPVLQTARGKVSTLPPLGLDKVVAQPQAGQMEMMVLKMTGHFGEGLVPAYTNAPAITIGDPGVALAIRAAAARAITGTNGIVAMKALVKEHPGTPLFHEWLAELFWNEKNYTGACNEYGKTSEAGVNMISAYRQQARCHLVIGNIPMAIDKTENAFLLNPDDPLLRRELSQLLVNTGSALIAKRDYQSASECLNRAAWLEPNSAEPLFQLAKLQLDIGQTNSAVGILKGVLKLKPNNVMARRMIDKLEKK